MKTFEFKDGSFINVTDGSTVTNLQVVVNTYAEIDPMREFFTEANMLQVTFDGQTYEGLIPIQCIATADSSKGVVVQFINKFKNDFVMERLRNQVSQLTQEKNDLEAQNLELSDKAAAADILLGNGEG